ncbi:MAG: ABC-2 transporter permease [Blautia sp.]|nr:ABC-2 transporter permease [Blautia sp.]
MLTICKREFRSYLTSMAGYVFIAFVLLVIGVYYTGYHMTMGYPIFGYTMSSSNFVFLIATPVLTMRALAEEQRQKTDQLLLTAPVSVTDIVVGKYLGMLGIFTILVLILCFYPAILSVYGTVSLPAAYTSILGFFLLGMADLAVGLFLSSLTENSVIAAVSTVGVLFLCFLMGGITSLLSETAATSYLILSLLVILFVIVAYFFIKNKVLALVIGVMGEGVLSALYFLSSDKLEGVIQKVLYVFDMSGHFDDFAEGILNLSNVVYFLSITVVFLFLTIQMIQKRRWS